jgi:hypothetical protein
MTTRASYPLTSGRVDRDSNDTSIGCRRRLWSTRLPGRTSVSERVRWPDASVANLLRWSSLRPHHGAPAFARSGVAVAHLGEIDPGKKRDVPSAHRSRPPKPQTGTCLAGWGVRTGSSIINRKGFPEIVRSSNQSVPPSSDSPKAAGPRTHVVFLSGEREPPTGRPWASGGEAALCAGL